MSDEVVSEQKKASRGAGRGSNFFALSQSVWAQLWNIPTSNRLNLVTAYLVLLAGTGSDHRLTKWSAKACEEHTGLGKPRAKHAIEELIEHGLVERTEASTRLMPQYRLPELPRDEDPIFMPVQMITGLRTETPILRRVRETGDAFVLRMLVDLYGMVQLDATYGVPLSNLRMGISDDKKPRKVLESGVHALWALEYGGTRNGGGDWATLHKAKGKAGTEAWAPFWERLDLLQKIGAVWFEPWVFAGDALDAEPLAPVDLGISSHGLAGDETTELSRRISQAAYALAEERLYVFDQYAADVMLPLPVHHQVPTLRGVAKLRVEPDTPGRRLAYLRRMRIVEQLTAAYDQLLEDVASKRFNRPLQLHATKEVV